MGSIRAFCVRPFCYVLVLVSDCDLVDAGGWPRLAFHWR